MLSPRQVEREAMRVLRKLSEPRTVLARASSSKGKERNSSWGIFSARNNWRRPVAQITDEYVQAFLSREFLVPLATEHPGALTGIAPRYDLGELGGAFLRRGLAGADAFSKQHQMLQSKTIRDNTGIRHHVMVNAAETPLGWLRNRKGPDGKALISAAEFEAGERLRADFTKAGLTAKVTADWSLAPGTAPKGRGGANTLEITDMALAARQRFAKALDSVGPGLSDVLVEVCCQLHGLEEAEKGLGWPKRAAKVVLKIALGRLADHYGLVPREGRKGRLRSWHSPSANAK